jgi:hypothetical protein
MHKYKLDNKKRTRFAIYPTLNVRYNKMKAGYSVLQTDKEKKKSRSIYRSLRKKDDAWI